MTKKKTHKEYVMELADKNPTVEVIDKYSGALTKIKHHCLIHDVCWETTPSRALRGVGCPICHGEKIASTKYKSSDEYIAEVKNVSPYIIVLEPYVEARIPILHKCTKHNVEWKAYPDNILKGCGCSECGNEKIGDKNRKSHKQYVDELKDSNENIIVVDEYINAITPILHKCLIDGYEWHASPANILYGTGCPMCCESKGEKRISKWLKSKNIKFESQKIFKDCRDIKPLPFDFYLPEYDLCIEFDGEQHYRPVEYFGGKKALEYIQKHDKIKTDYCKNNNIQLLRISHKENIEEELNNFLFI